MQELQEMWVQSLGQEDPLQESMTTTPVFLPGESHGRKSLVQAIVHGVTESDMTEQLHFSKHMWCGVQFTSLNNYNLIDIKNVNYWLNE